MTWSQASNDPSTTLRLETEFTEGYLLAKLSGVISFKGWLERYKHICDIAAAKGVHKILIDGLAVTGELSLRERHELGREGAAYPQSKRMAIKIAVLGKEPTMNGIGVSVSQNRGLNAEAFYDRQRAIEWLLNPSKSAVRS